MPLLRSHLGLLIADGEMGAPTGSSGANNGTPVVLHCAQRSAGTLAGGTDDGIASSPFEILGILVSSLSALRTE